MELDALKEKCAQQKKQLRLLKEAVLTKQRDEAALREKLEASETQRRALAEEAEDLHRQRVSASKQISNLAAQVAEAEKKAAAANGAKWSGVADTFSSGLSMFGGGQQMKDEVTRLTEQTQVLSQELELKIRETEMLHARQLEVVKEHEAELSAVQEKLLHSKSVVERKEVEQRRGLENYKQLEGQMKGLQQKLADTNLHAAEVQQRMAASQRRSAATEAALAKRYRLLAETLRSKVPFDCHAVAVFDWQNIHRRSVVLSQRAEQAVRQQLQVKLPAHLDALCEFIACWSRLSTAASTFGLLSQLPAHIVARASHAPVDPKGGSGAVWSLVGRPNAASGPSTAHSAKDDSRQMAERLREVAIETLGVISNRLAEVKTSSAKLLNASPLARLTDEGRLAAANLRTATLSLPKLFTRLSVCEQLHCAAELREEIILSAALATHQQAISIAGDKTAAALSSSTSSQRPVSRISDAHARRVAFLKKAPGACRHATRSLCKAIGEIVHFTTLLLSRQVSLEVPVMRIHFQAAMAHLARHSRSSTSGQSAEAPSPDNNADSSHMTAEDCFHENPAAAAPTLRVRDGKLHEFLIRSLEKCLDDFRVAIELFEELHGGRVSFTHNGLDILTFYEAERHALDEAAKGVREASDLMVSLTAYRENTEAPTLRQATSQYFLFYFCNPNGIQLVDGPMPLSYDRCRSFMSDTAAHLSSQPPGVPYQEALVLKAQLDLAEAQTAELQSEVEAVAKAARRANTEAERQKTEATKYADEVATLAARLAVMRANRDDGSSHEQQTRIPSDAPHEQVEELQTQRDSPRVANDGEVSLTAAAGRRNRWDIGDSRLEFLVDGLKLPELQILPMEDESTTAGADELRRIYAMDIRRMKMGLSMASQRMLDYRLKLDEAFKKIQLSEDERRFAAANSKKMEEALNSSKEDLKNVRKGYSDQMGALTEHLVTVQESLAAREQALASLKSCRVACARCGGSNPLESLLRVKKDGTPGGGCVLCGADVLLPTEGRPATAR